MSEPHGEHATHSRYASLSFYSPLSSSYFLITYSLTNVLTYSLTHLLTYSLTHLLACELRPASVGAALLLARTKVPPPSKSSERAMFTVTAVWSTCNRRTVGDGGCKRR